MQEQTIFIGNIPLMNSMGTFIVNGIALLCSFFIQATLLFST